LKRSLVIVLVTKSSVICVCGLGGVLMKILADAEWFFFPACEVIV
jgi:hypothetical protein